MTVDSKSSPPIEFSIIIPMNNESENVSPLICEITGILDNHFIYEIICIDDGSKDSTLSNLITLKGEHKNLRICHHKNCKGQSSAIISGVCAARGDVIVTLDGDGQNDPADIPKLVGQYNKEAEFHETMIVGWRTQRQDNWVRKLSSGTANWARSVLLSDATPDTGCGLKVFGREMFLKLPQFDHMHRFLPILAVRGGGRVFSFPVNHRSRVHGSSSYGIWNRLWIGIVDVIGVMWLVRRPISDIPAFDHERAK